MALPSVLWDYLKQFKLKHAQLSNFIVLGISQIESCQDIWMSWILSLMCSLPTEEWFPDLSLLLPYILEGGQILLTWFVCSISCVAANNLLLSNFLKAHNRRPQNSLELVAFIVWFQHGSLDLVGFRFLYHKDDW